MGASRTQAEKALDRRRNAAARREVLKRDRRRSVTENLEEGLALQAAAAEFGRAFAETRRSPER